MPWPKLIQVFLGSTLGIAILLGGAVGVGFLLVRQFSALPPRPVFENDFPSPSPSAVVASPTLTPTPTPVPSPAELEPGAYRAVVAYPSGLACGSFLVWRRIRWAEWIFSRGWWSWKLVAIRIGSGFAPSRGSFKVG